MSAMLVDEALTTTQVTTRPRWRHVPTTRGPVARPSNPVAPGGRPSVGAVPLVRACSAAPVVAHQNLQLTRRGLAVVMGLFLGVVAVAAVTLVVAFFSVPNEARVPASVSAVAVSAVGAAQG